MEDISKSPWKEVGRGAVVSTKSHPAWYANAVVNNPTATATGGVAVAGAASQAPRFERKRSTKKERAADVGAGAAMGAGAGIAADRGVFYALKNEYKKSKYNGGSKAARRDVKAVKAEAKAKYPDNPRKEMDHINRHYPKNAPGATYRRLATRRTGGKNAAALAVTGAAIGAGLAASKNKKEIKKMADHADSPFLISKKENKKPMSAGRKVTGTALSPYHGLVAGKGVKGKAKSSATQLGLGVGGALGGAAAGATLTRNPGVAAATSLVGSYAGTFQGTKIAHKRGWLKPEKKK